MVVKLNRCWQDYNHLGVLFKWDYYTSFIIDNVVIQLNILYFDSISLCYWEYKAGGIIIDSEYTLL